MKLRVNFLDYIFSFFKSSKAEALIKFFSPEFPKSSSLRVAYFTIFLTAVLITTHYSAALISFLTVCIRVLPFQTIDEFVDDGTYKLIVPRGSADYDVISVSLLGDQGVRLSLRAPLSDRSYVVAFGNITITFNICRRVSNAELTMKR